MRRITACLLALCLLLCCSPAMAVKARMPEPARLGRREAASVVANGSVERSRFLDAAFSMLEEGNPFQLRYNAIAGANIRSLFELGVPYFFGGKSAEPLFSKYPDYIVMRSWQDNSYFKNDVNYIYGFDCAGFTMWVWNQAGKGEHGSLVELLNDEEHHFYCSKKPMPAWDELYRTLQVGDLVVLHHPGSRHCGMYIGTLRQYGYTALEVPDLEPYLDYPLIIHCAGHPAFGDRFQFLIDNGLQKYRHAATTNGGVCVALLGVRKDQATHQAKVQDADYGWFVLPDYTFLTVLDWTNVDPEAYCWYR